MRFARTEVFAIGRRIFHSMDGRFVEDGILEQPGDLHYLDIAEIRGAIRGTLPPVDLRAIVRDRRARFEGYRIGPVPSSRLETVGPVVVAIQTMPAAAAEAIADRTTLVGTAVCAGIVRGPCRLVDDPRDVTPRPGEIVVARSTDPGWVPILMAASGLLVERGSLLSHSAIVARELGLPTIVGIDGLMASVGDGQIVRMDGSSGVVQLDQAPKLQPATLERSR
jgi:pyruvate,water dikinase